MAAEPLPKSIIFGTSGLGGCLGWVLVHPFNTLAVRMNLASGSGKKVPGFPTFASNIVNTEGYGALYKGLGAGILRQLFYATSRYGLFEVFRDNYADYDRSNGGSGEIGFGVRFVSASVAGGCAALIACPCEVALVRMSNDLSLPVEQRRNYTGIADVAKRIFVEEGVSTFWSGATPFVSRAIVVGGTQVATFDQFKITYNKYFGFEGLMNTFAASLSAGLVYATITMPLESTKNRMAFQKPDPVSGKMPYTSIPQTITTIARTEGVLALWNGFLPYYGRCGGHTIAMFIIVDELRKMYRGE